MDRSTFLPLQHTPTLIFSVDWGLHPSQISRDTSRHSPPCASRAPPDHILIIDVKTGQPKPWHKFQLMLYMYTLPRAIPEYRDANLAAKIIHNDHTNHVPQGGIHQGFVRNLGSLIRRIAAPEQPPTTAGAAECRFCDITLQDCPDRIESVFHPCTPATDDF